MPADTRRRTTTAPVAGTQATLTNTHSRKVNFPQNLRQNKHPTSSRTARTMSYTHEKLSLKEENLIFAEEMTCLHRVPLSKFVSSMRILRIPAGTCQLFTRDTSLVN